ncbi:MAG TPA: diaminopimelate decarboxylase [Actinomycetota bacterium]
MTSGPWPPFVELGPEGLLAGGRHAEDLASEFGTPLVVVDEGHVRARCRAFVGAFDRALWAVKAFPAQALIDIVRREGMGLLAATGGELDTCLRAGAPPEAIVLHGNNKTDAELHRAVAEGVGHLILDSEEDVLRIDAVARGRGATQPVLLRIAPGVEVSTHQYVTTGAPDTKFGVPVAGGMAMAALKRALAAPNLALRGLHVHVGSQLLDLAPYLGALEVALDLLAEARRELGFEAAVLDVGGGIGSSYVDEEPPSPEELGRAVGEALEAGARERGLPRPELWAEPGRAITGGAAITLYRVGSVKEVPGIRRYVAVDGGMSDNIRPALYGSRYTFALASRPGEAPESPVAVVGRHCESGDILAERVSLPGDVRRDDLLAVAATGAYEYAMASTYNKVGRPAVILVGDDGPRLILRREDEDDLARLDVGPPGVDLAEAPPGVRVRSAVPRDARGVTILVEAVALEGRYLRTERPAFHPRGVRRRLRRSWTRESAELVAVSGRRVVGQLSAVRERGRATHHVASFGMAVAAEWRGKGVGSALIAEAIRWARWAGVEKLTLSVFPHNDAARALYRKFGFQDEGVLRAHTRKSSGYEDEVVMARWV